MMYSTIRPLAIPTSPSNLRNKTK